MIVCDFCQYSHAEFPDTRSALLAAWLQVTTRIGVGMYRERWICPECISAIDDEEKQTWKELASDDESGE